jgi:hypothetical protein
MPFGYPRITIPGPAHYGSGQVQGLDNIDLETKTGNSNMYSTWTLVNPSLVAYIKPRRGAPRGTTYNIDILQTTYNIDILHTTYNIDILHTTDLRLDIDERDSIPPLTAPCKHL